MTAEKDKQSRGSPGELIPADLASVQTLLLIIFS